MTGVPDERSEVKPQALMDWFVSQDLSEPASEEQFQAWEHDGWFHQVAAPNDVAERQWRMVEARRDMSDSAEAGDADRFDIASSLWEHAFWDLPTVEHAEHPAFLDEATYSADAADDDADGWY